MALKAGMAILQGGLAARKRTANARLLNRSELEGRRLITFI